MAERIVSVRARSPASSLRRAWSWSAERSRMRASSPDLVLARDARARGEVARGEAVRGLHHLAQRTGQGRGERDGQDDGHREGQAEGERDRARDLLRLLLDAVEGKGHARHPDERGRHGGWGRRRRGGPRRRWRCAAPRCPSRRAARPPPPAAPAWFSTAARSGPERDGIGQHPAVGRDDGDARADLAGRAVHEGVDLGRRRALGQRPLHHARHEPRLREQGRRACASTVRRAQAGPHEQEDGEEGGGGGGHRRPPRCARAGRNASFGVSRYAVAQRLHGHDRGRERRASSRGGAARARRRCASPPCTNSPTRPAGARWRERTRPRASMRASRSANSLAVRWTSWPAQRTRCRARSTSTHADGVDAVRLVLAAPGGGRGPAPAPAAPWG